MNDNDIIKALENCKNNGDCKDCILNPHVGNYGYCTSIAIEAALDLINRQKAEIERLKGMVSQNEGVFLPEYEKLIIAEAIKEFAERLKKKRGTHGEIWDNDIENLVKEMTEETP